LKIRILQKQQENSRKQHKRNRRDCSNTAAAKMYGLTILVQIQTITLNMTRFVNSCKQNSFTEKEQINKSLKFELDHKEAA
jgi:prephenate dehydratase